MTADALLGIYLNDHLAGSVVALEVFHRLIAADPPGAQELRRLEKEVDQDRESLLGIMIALHTPVQAYKPVFAWVAEKVGRLKLNGRLFSRSPLSTVLELEILRLGVEGKGAGWRTLRRLADDDARLDPRQLDELIERAVQQIQALEELRVTAAGLAFTSPTARH